MRTTTNSRSHLSGLPVEIVEDVLLYLSPPVMVKLRVVRVSVSSPNLAFLTNCCYQLNRRVRDLVDASPTIQYRVELFAASLEDNLGKPSVSVADRRALLKKYHTRWDRLRGDKWKSVTLPVHTKRILDGGVLGCIIESRGGKLDVLLIRLPSASREVRPKRWLIRGLPKCDATLAINSEMNLLVVPEVLNERRCVIYSFINFIAWC
jgi:hypothetical protein